MPVRHIWTLTRAIVAPYCTEAGFRALRNLVGIGACTGLGNLCAAATLLLMTSCLSPAAFGAFVVAQTVQSYLLLLSCGGTLTVTIREAARHLDRLDAITTAHIVLNVGTALLLGLLAVAASWLLPLGAEERWVLAILLLGNVAAAAHPLTLFDLHHRQGLGTVFSLAGEVLGLAAMGLLAWHDALSLPAVGLVFAGKWIAVSAGQALTYHLAVRRFRWQLCGTTLRTMFRSAWPTALAVVVALVPLNAGVIFVRIFRGEDEAGLYGLAYQVAYAYLLLGSLGTRILQPHIAGPHGFNPHFIRKLALFAISFNVAGGTLAFLAGYSLIGLLLGSQYSAAIYPLGALTLAACVYSLNAINSMYLVSLAGERLLFLIQCGVGVGFIVTCFCFSATGLETTSLLAAGWLLLGILACLLGCKILFKPDEQRA